MQIHANMWLGGIAAVSETIKTILPEDRIREYCKTQPIQRLSLFGSALRNELTSSDIDFLVEYMPDANFEALSRNAELSEIVGQVC